MQKRQLPSGKWQFTEGFKDKDGKYRRITVIKPNKTRASEKEAYEELQEKIKQVLLSEKDNHRKVSFYKKEFLDYKKNTVTRGTYDTYFNALTLLDDDLLITELTKIKCEKKLIDLRSIYKPTTIKQICVLWKNFFKFINEYYHKDFYLNIAFKLTKEDRHEERLKIKYIETNKVKEVINNIDSSLVKDICTVQLLTGIRIGELLALQPSDINIENKTITISKTKTHYNKLNSPKTISSYRTIDIDNLTLSILVKYISASDFLFNISQTNISYHLRKLNISSHMFRHTHVALLIEAGVPIKAISERLGHSDTNITLKIYTHVTENMKNNLKNKIESFAHILRTY